MYNEGQNAVLGNTDELNSFVEDIRNMARGKNSMDKMLWVVGPTATGKSELKRCLVNGLKEYSKTDEGKRYTLSWKVEGGSSTGNLGFVNDDVYYEEKGEWIKSPVQENPLRILYKEVRNEYLSDIKEETGQKIDIDGDLSPFDRSFLKEKGVEGYQEIFESKKELKVVDYVMDRGQGIGILQSEDEGTPKQRMIGKWSRNREDVKRFGSGDPRVFEYSGVFSKGNNGLTVLEDVIQYLTGKSLIERNIPFEGYYDGSIEYFEHNDIDVSVEQILDIDYNTPRELENRQLRNKYIESQIDRIERVSFIEKPENLEGYIYKEDEPVGNTVMSVRYFSVEPEKKGVEDVDMFLKVTPRAFELGNQDEFISSILHEYNHVRALNRVEITGGDKYYTEKESELKWRDLYKDDLYDHEFRDIYSEVKENIRKPVMEILATKEQIYLHENFLEVTERFDNSMRNYQNYNIGRLRNSLERYEADERLVEELEALVPEN